MLFQKRENEYREITGDGEVVSQKKIDRLTARLNKSREHEEEEGSGSESEPVPRPTPSGSPVPSDNSPAETQPNSQEEGMDLQDPPVPINIQPQA